MLGVIILCAVKVIVVAPNTLPMQSCFWPKNDLVFQGDQAPTKNMFSHFFLLKRLRKVLEFFFQKRCFSFSISKLKLTLSISLISEPAKSFEEDFFFLQNFEKKKSFSID
jgi:hypothetical protein